MAEQRCDRDLREAEIVGHAGEAVAKDMGRDVLKFRTLDDLLPMAGKAAKRLVVVPPRKRVGAYVLGAVRAPFIKILQYRKADWPDRLSFLGVVEADRKSNTSELQSLIRISYSVLCLQKKKTHN